MSESSVEGNELFDGDDEEVKEGESSPEEGEKTAAGADNATDDEVNDPDKGEVRRKRKKDDKHTSPYVDNEAEDDDDEDEDGYDDDDDDDAKYRERKASSTTKGGSSGLKKRKLSKKRYLSTFLDTEAQVGDDEEEEYASSYVDEFEEAKKLEKKKMYEMKLKSGTNHLAQTINKLSQRYENEKDIKDTLTDGETLTDEDMSGDEDEYFDEGECLTTFDSPKMWLIKLFKNGVERNIAMGIYYKYMKLKDNDFNIKGVYVSDNLKGYIYVEADSLYMLKRFLLGFKFINLNEMTIVPVQELTSIFSMCHSKVIIPKVNEYVRIKRGVYMNDIGQIFEVHEKGIYAIVRLIPRIEYDKYNHSKKGNNTHLSLTNPSMSKGASSMFDGQSGKNESYYQGDNKLELNNHGSRAIIPAGGMVGGDTRNAGMINGQLEMLDEALQIKRKKKKERPLKKLFDREEIEQIGGVIEHGPYPRTIKYQNNIFEENGYLLKKMNIKYLISENANITLTEIRDFNKNNSNEEDINLHVSKSFINKNSLHLFKKGERVKIMKGELYNLIGTITNVSDNVLTINPDNLAKNFKFLPSDVTKYFLEGDNVTVINGIHKGKSGLISLLDYKENVALIFSPSLNTEFRSSIQDLSACEHSSSEGLGGINSLNGFSIGDLIELSDRQIGILTYIDKNKHIRVLTSHNTTLHTTIGTITSKRSAIGQVCKDENGNIIQAKDIIQVVRGIHKNKVAVVNYIWKNKVFAKINKKIEDNGFVVMDSHNCILTGNPNEKKRIVTHNNLFRANTSIIPRRNNTYQSFIGKTVKILSGVYKGLLGDVIDAERDEFTLLLKIKPKTIRQKKNECAIADSFKDHYTITDDRYYKGSGGASGGEVLDNSSRWRNISDRSPRYDRVGYDRIGYESSLYGESARKSADWHRGSHSGNYDEERWRGSHRPPEGHTPDHNPDRSAAKGANGSNDINASSHAAPWNQSNGWKGTNSSHQHPPPPISYDQKNFNGNWSKTSHENHSNSNNTSYNYHHDGRASHPTHFNEPHSRGEGMNEGSIKNATRKNNMAEEFMNGQYETGPGSHNLNTDQRYNDSLRRGGKNNTSSKGLGKWDDVQSTGGINGGVSNTGFTSASNFLEMHRDKNNEDKASPLWLVEGIMIKVITPGPFYNEIGRVTEVMKKSLYTILKIATEKTSFSIVSDAVIPLNPNKINEEVLVVDEGKVVEGIVVDIQNDDIQVNTAQGIFTYNVKNIFLFKKQFP
ncbi:transcription elongation factor SPT5, putative [Plasmodium knowlesi strain H]|uniref:Transcription elongation factor SPT5 n=3 Tax=Plasmodium knowlesi TaxID=5850 RepID=A0A5K1TVA9_PLAKH|nr:transcription elongation factor SPT5, putative [Plasmodium knowlesi strain H]OTN64721.1 Transcription elongation factor SPT5 [Plasmodium knowlesi]CAA9989220.1 transcription elongation factor SPT5, putative [Plasmodium knowlesi strain H]SBO26224.1 transcription elongation factor SPT5, putative [Plasmodium knowlesi strain H]SBO27200.1 transcription elongation factor SPT5, putative [Plasmodium knowlesi strain H]VVS78694.1 transcription elongation factor SPT5, putative [Plasmodium knowlesi stra|eukprot:XP_002261565.1 transcription factor, putative [Plasmodium knowlesi strain H]